MQENNENIDVLSIFEIEKKDELLKNDNNIDNSLNNNNDILPNIVFNDKKDDNVIDLNSLNSLENDILINSSNQNNILENFENKTNFIEEEKEIKKTNKILELFKFLSSYLTTSAVIFFILLWVLNYNSYIQFARSYFNKDEIELNKNAMLASVASSNISKKEENKEEINEIEKLEKEKEEEFEFNAIKQAQSLKNTTFHSMNKLVDWNWDNDINIDVSIIPYENRIVIPKIWKNIPLLNVKAKKVKNVKELEDIFMEELTNWIVRYPWSAKPGEEWNSFVFWHSSNFPWIKWDYNDVFALLDNVVFGDEIIAYYWQKKYIYKIKEKKIVKPWDVSVLKRETWKKEISLMTCWPLGTTLNRMIVIWELVEEK